MGPTELTITLPGLRLKNPNNGQTGNTRIAAVIRTRERARVRKLVREVVSARVRVDGAELLEAAQLSVTFTRISPGKLDAWDGLSAALKPCVDAVADVFGARDDDPRFAWERPRQRKSGRGVYGLEIVIAGGAS